MDPNGKVALITGGARIGQVVADALANRGCSLSLTYRDSRDAAEKTAGAATPFAFADGLDVFLALVELRFVERRLSEERFALAMTQFMGPSSSSETIQLPDALQ